MPGHIRRNLLIFLALLIAPAAVGALHWLLPAGELKDAAGIVQAVITAAAIIGGGLVAAYKLQLFRDFAPHLTITHEVSHRPVGDSYVHIAVKAALHNGSRVKMDFRKGFLLLQQVSPTSDAEVTRLFQQWQGDDHSSHFQWRTLYENHLAWDENDLIVEPGEDHQELYQFIVAAEVESVIVYTYYYNSQPATGAEGWGLATVYDITRSR